jgi:hypothetical protein
MLTIITLANAQVNVDFLENGRGGHYLLHAGFMFSVRTSRNNRRYCKCLSRDCLATIVTVDNLPVSFGENQHEVNSVLLCHSLKNLHLLVR